MTKKLTFKEYMFIGSMLFGLFFGAGNLIFPVHMGQEAGASIFWANLGFLVTGIGLPFLGVIAIGVSKTAGVYELAKRINQTYAMVFTILLYLVIGPFFALPRLATTSYEIGLAPFIQSDQQTLFLAIFSILFFFRCLVAFKTADEDPRLCREIFKSYFLSITWTLIVTSIYSSSRYSATCCCPTELP